MAKVEISVPREQEGHFGLYRASAGGDQAIIIRRKVGEPTDYMHTKSRAVRHQREIFSQASQHYSHLTSTQKAWTRRQFEEVEVIKSHGPSDIKLLTGRQLFISKDIRELNVTQRQIKPVLEVCIILIDPLGDPIEGELWLRYLKDGVWLECEKEQLSPLDWLFPNVPRGMESYHPYGESPGYLDLEDPATTYLTEAQLSKYHHHELLFIPTPDVWSFSTYGRAIGFSHRVKRDATRLYLKSIITTKNIDDTFRHGPGVYSPYKIPGSWIAYEDFPVSPDEPDPKTFTSLFTGLDFKEGDFSWLFFAFTVWPVNKWSIIVHYCDIP